MTDKELSNALEVWRDLGFEQKYPGDKDSVFYNEKVGHIMSSLCFKLAPLIKADRERAVKEATVDELCRLLTTVRDINSYQVVHLAVIEERINQLTKEGA